MLTFKVGSKVLKSFHLVYISTRVCLSSKFMSSKVPHKRARLSEMDLQIATHNGTFHCDEVLAVWMLKRTARFGNGKSKLIRTRTPELIDQANIVVDVGGVFDHSKSRYDHHQRSFTETFHSLDPSKPWKTKLSSAGLIYVHFGFEVVRRVMEKLAADLKGDKSLILDETVSKIYEKIYENFVEEIDAVDNGIALSDATPRYKVTTTLSKRVGNLNPAWNEETNDEKQMAQFEKAMEMVGAEFIDRVKYYQFSWLPAYSSVRAAVEKRFDIHQSGEIICLPQSGVPWKEHIMSIEEELGITKPIKYVLYEDSTNKRWRIQCVPVSADSFANRLTMPSEWCGVRDEQLSELTGIPQCVFVHANGFIGGNQTYDGVLKMATESLRIAAEK